MSELKDVLDFLEGMANVGNSMAQSNLQFAKAESAQLHREKMAENALKIKEEQLVLNQQNNNMQNVQKQQIAIINDFIDTGYDYGVSFNEHANLNDKDKTKEMQELIQTFDIHVNNDLSVSTGIYDTMQENLSLIHI